MTEWKDPEKDRRQHSRSAVRIPFFCYVDGQRFDSDAFDLSSGGAFLRTDDKVRLSAPVLLLPKSAKTKKPVILVVGHVVRQQPGPPRGLGIRWGKVVSRGGLSVILKLAALVPTMFPEELPAPTREFIELPTVGYSFKDHGYFVPDLSGPAKGGPMRGGPEQGRAVLAEARRSETKRTALPMEPPVSTVQRVETHQEMKSPTSYWGLDGETTKVVPPRRKTEPIPAPNLERAAAPTARPTEDAARSIASPESFSRTAGIGPVTEILAYEQVQIPVSIQVGVRCSGRKHVGALLRLGMSNCFVACADIFAGDLVGDERIDVQLTIDLHSRKHEVGLQCRLIAFGSDPRTDRSGLSLEIRAVEQPGSPGLFERYVKYLYYHMINEA